VDAPKTTWDNHLLIPLNDVTRRPANSPTREIVRTKFTWSQPFREHVLCPTPSSRSKTIFYLAGKFKGHSGVAFTGNIRAMIGNRKSDTFQWQVGKSGGMAFNFRMAVEKVTGGNLRFMGSRDERQWQVF
jgi:hypothetical protein